MRASTFTPWKIPTTFALSVALAASPLNAQEEDDPDVEEVVVTGSYIKRSAANSPSALSVVTTADIEDLGVADVAEIVQTMPWQSGSQSRASTFQGEGADGRNSVNLRNLGHGATLPLVNGKRHVPSWYNGRGNASVNVNGLVPTIAIERMEIVKDGASALYGSDAVAGVVNFITKRNFEGFDFNYQWSTDTETGEGETTQGEVIFGIQGDRGGVVASASFLNRGEINVDDRYDRFGGSTASGTGQPGRITPVSGQEIIWAAHGKRPGETVDAEIDGGTFPRNAQGTSFGQADVDCENAAALEQGGALGPVFGNLICAYDFGSFFALQAEESLRKGHITGYYDLDDNFEAYFEFAFNGSTFDRKNSLNPNSPTLVIPKEHFGNIEDAYRRGIEPVLVLNRTRLQGGTRHTSEDRRPEKTFTNTNRSDNRLVLGFNYELDLGANPMSLDISYTASDHVSSTAQVQDTLSSHMELAIQGLGGPFCDVINGTPGEGNLAYAESKGDYDAGKCYYFNPFGNSRHARDGSPVQNDLKLVNPPELYQWLIGRASSDTDYRQRVLDAVVTTELFEMGSGSAAVAVGFQRRRDYGGLLVDSSLNTNNLDFAYGAQDWNAQLTTTGFFVEVSVPLTSFLEIDAAIRNESFEEIDQSTTDPKFSVLLRPTDSLSMRASVSSSFRIPSMQQLFGRLTTVHNMTDYGGVTAYRAAITRGNDELKPEAADTWNVGVSWSPVAGFLDGFQIDFDYYNYEYTDIITRESHETILKADNAALGAAVDGGMTLVQAINAGVGNRDQVIRNNQGLLQRVLPNFLNANSATVNGFDISTSYSFDTGFGSWRLGVQAAKLLTYDVELPPNADGEIEVLDAVGNYNRANPVARPLPDLKVNTTLNWSYNNHRVFLLMHHVSEVHFEELTRYGAAGYWRATVALALGEKASEDFYDDKIDAFTPIDIQYTYDFNDFGLMNSGRITLGIKNVTNLEPPWVPEITSYDGTLHDPRGRMWFLRFSGSM